MTTHRLPERTWTYIVLLYLFFIYLPLIISRSDSTESFLQGDSYYYRAIMDSLLNDGDLLMANNVPTDPLNGQLAIGTDGFVPKHPILLPLVSLPFYYLFGNPGLLLFNILDCMILMVLIFRLNCLFFDHPIAFITTILYATGTLFLDYAYSFSPDIFSTVLLLAGLYLTIRGRFYISAVLLGLSIFAKLPNALLAGIILSYAGFLILRREDANNSAKENFRNQFTVAITTAVIFLISLVPFAYANYLLFGSPVITGYQRTAVAGADGQMISADHASKFNQPLLKGTFLSLFAPRNGILPTNPVLILAFLGVFRIKRSGDQSRTYLILLLCLVQFVLFAKYDEWYMSHFSNRFLMTFVALSSVFTSHFLSYLSRRFSLETSKQDSGL